MFSKNAKASGEMARFLQLRIEKDNSLTKEEADNYFGKLFDNYGHAGEVYAQWIISNLDTVKTALSDTQKNIDKAWNITGEDRKYSATLAAVFLGAKISKALGIHNIEIEPVQKAIYAELEKSKIDLKARDFDAMETLTEFLHENLKNTLVINSKTDARSGLLEAPLLKPIYELRVRIEPDVNTIYIPVGIMRTYLETKGNVTMEDFVAKLKDNKILKPKSGELKVIQKGLEVSGSGRRCIWIDNSTFDDIKTNNLPLDIPRSVN